MRDEFIEFFMRLCWMTANVTIGLTLAFFISLFYVDINYPLVALIFVSLRFCMSKFWAIRG